MSVYSSVSCPKCGKYELSIAHAYFWNRIRLMCVDECGYVAEIEISDKEASILSNILNRRPRKEDFGNTPLKDKTKNG